MGVSTAIQQLPYERIVLVGSESWSFRPQEIGNLEACVIGQSSDDSSSSEEHLAHLQESGTKEARAGTVSSR